MQNIVKVEIWACLRNLLISNFLIKIGCELYLTIASLQISAVGVGFFDFLSREIAKRLII